MNNSKEMKLKKLFPGKWGTKINYEKMQNEKKLRKKDGGLAWVGQTYNSIIFTQKPKM